MMVGVQLKKGKIMGFNLERDWPLAILVAFAAFLLLMFVACTADAVNKNANKLGVNQQQVSASVYCVEYTRDNHKFFVFKSSNGIAVVEVKD